MRSLIGKAVKTTFKVILLVGALAVAYVVVPGVWHSAKFYAALETSAQASKATSTSSISDRLDLAWDHFMLQEDARLDALYLLVLRGRSATPSILPGWHLPSNFVQKMQTRHPGSSGMVAATCPDGVPKKNVSYTSMEDKHTIPPGFPSIFHYKVQESASIAVEDNLEVSTHVTVRPFWDFSELPAYTGEGTEEAVKKAWPGFDFVCPGAAPQGELEASFTAAGLPPQMRELLENDSIPTSYQPTPLQNGDESKSVRLTVQPEALSTDFAKSGTLSRTEAGTLTLQSPPFSDRTQAVKAFEILQKDLEAGQLKQMEFFWYRKGNTEAQRVVSYRAGEGKLRVKLLANPNNATWLVRLEWSGVPNRVKPLTKR